MKNKQKGFAIPIIIAIVALLALGGGVLYLKNVPNDFPCQPPFCIPEKLAPISTTTLIVGGDKDDLVACTMDAKQCPDGSYVGHSGPKCEFVCPVKPNNMIRVSQPIINTVVSSPITITGEARGGWYFEGSFPVRIEDANGNILGQHYASAKGEWMTNEYVPFTSELAFTNSNTETGILILSKDNPSDLREFDDEILIPIRFNIEQNSELMDLLLYIQDTSYVATSSCSVTKKIVYKIPKTVAVADASLKILFNNELSSYGVYKSVSIVDGVAKILLESDLTKAGVPINSLSSCESSHLLAVLKDTLTQYSSVKSVELFSPKGQINF
jgi:hypothetical protein